MYLLRISLLDHAWIACNALHTMRMQVGPCRSLGNIHNAHITPLKFEESVLLLTLVSYSWLPSPQCMGKLQCITNSGVQHGKHDR